MRSRVPLEPHKALASTTPDHVVDDGSEKSLLVATPVNSGGSGTKGPRTSRIRRRHGVIITDGPFAETKEVVGSVAPPNAARR